MLYIYFNVKLNEKFAFRLLDAKYRIKIFSFSHLAEIPK